MHARVIFALLLLTSFGRGESLAQSQPSSGATASPAPQQLTVVCLRYTASADPLQITDHFSTLSPEDIALLQKCLPHGTAVVWSVGVHDKGPKAKAILLLTGPFQHEVVVAQPWQSTAVYIQRGQEMVC